MTNEEVAIKLGWVKMPLPHQQDYIGWVWGYKKGERRKGDHHLHCPKFTTSLDAIVGEIERRGADTPVWKYMNYHGLSPWDAGDCCKALIAYIADTAAEEPER